MAVLDKGNSPVEKAEAGVITPGPQSQAGVGEKLDFNKKPQRQPDTSTRDLKNEYKTQAASPHIWVEIPFLSPEDTIESVYIGVNGVDYWVKKGVRIPLPACAVAALDNAEVKGYVPVMDEDGRRKQREIRYKRFPYLSYGPADPQEVEAWKKKNATRPEA